MPKQNQEDYLRAIYYLREKTGRQETNSVDIANSLNISKAAVSKMLKKLAARGVVRMRPYSSICLTKKGFKTAANLTYKHRMIEVFLVNILKVKKKDIHQEAHNLEHAFSDRVVKKLARFLNYPKICPSGKIIPNFN